MGNSIFFFKYQTVEINNHAKIYKQNSFFGVYVHAGTYHNFTTTTVRATRSASKRERECVELDWCHVESSGDQSEATFFKVLDTLTTSLTSWNNSLAFGLVWHTHCRCITDHPHYPFIYNTHRQGHLGSMPGHTSAPRRTQSIVNKIWWCFPSNLTPYHKSPLPFLILIFAEKYFSHCMWGPAANQFLLF